MNNEIQAFTDQEVELMYSDEYAEFLMNNSDLPIGNGDMLLEQMEDCYMFEEFLVSLK